ncbi:hypothetical protein [Pyrobaculum ferrireducens]|uniref:Uncharacterized protein n=1 Tax=Pyrobaculum ferrireducens TaxID=1104324 RepID=G7VAJ3_9CREN|nr:hypothetical protein [Pyrobaculum ferrireducens]AET32232.1 hypothetical protein P186_0786 [Pyrobaculum ferrireducens]
MKRLLLMAIAAAALAGAIFSFLNNTGIADVSTLRGVKTPGEYVVSGALRGVEITDRYVVLRLAGGGFEITAVGDRRGMEALYGPITPASFENTVVVRGVYYPANRTLVITAILRGCHSAYGQPAANTR